MPEGCEIKEVKLSGGGSKNIVVCNRDDEEKSKEKQADEKPAQKMKTITICDENSLECETNEVPMNLQIRGNLPDNCKIE